MKVGRSVYYGFNGALFRDKNGPAFRVHRIVQRSVWVAAGISVFDAVEDFDG